MPKFLEHKLQKGCSSSLAPGDKHIVIAPLVFARVTLGPCCNMSFNTATSAAPKAAAGKKWLHSMNEHEVAGLVHIQLCSSASPSAALQPFR